MNRVFLDANVLFSAAWRESAGLLRLWDMKEAKLIASRYAVEEARRNLENDGQRSLLLQLLNSVEIVADCMTGVLPEDIVLPEKDLPIMLSAINAHASHLLTGDRRHFSMFYGRTVSGVLVLRPADYT